MKRSAILEESMKLNLPTLALDKSNAWRIYFEGDNLTVEHALQHGFVVSHEDAPAILTLIPGMNVPNEIFTVTRLDRTRPDQ